MRTNLSFFLAASVFSADLVFPIPPALLFLFFFFTPDVELAENVVDYYIGVIFLEDLIFDMSSVCTGSST